MLIKQLLKKRLKFEKPPVKFEKKLMIILYIFLFHSFKAPIDIGMPS